ncbi:hypothetical protein BC830DRAFT_573788 [Chytriomyces sp. MP71]|nr:hypothetical protein BC830DRAFT_573788 [Chytriomyces sp. MP71]
MVKCGTEPASSHRKPNTIVLIKPNCALVLAATATLTWIAAVLFLCSQGMTSLSDPYTFYCFADVSVLLFSTILGFFAISYQSSRGILLFAVYSTTRCVLDVSANIAFAVWRHQADTILLVVPHLIVIITEPFITYVLVSGFLMELRVAIVNEEVAMALEEGYSLRVSTC